MPASTSAFAFFTISSMRPGWMRPSAIRRSRARRPISRRTGSKQDTTTVSGVSSMMTSTPVAASNARMLRSEEHTSELQSRRDLVCRLLLEKKKQKKQKSNHQKQNKIIQKKHQNKHIK